MIRLLSAFLLIPCIAFGQAVSVPGVLILKVKPEFKAAVLRLGPHWEGFDGVPVNSVRQMFPQAEVPNGRTDRHGNPFVDLTGIFRAELGQGADLMSISERWTASGRFEWVEHTTYSESFSTPDDPYLPSQNHLVQIGAFAAWDVTQGDTTVVIGVTDTSFDLLHQDLQDNLKYNYDDPIDGQDNDNDGFIDNHSGWDIVDGDNNLFVANNFHGTGVLAVSSASTDNGIGVAGVAYGCKYLPVKIANNAGVIETADGYEAITYCADRDCNVINCSWGTTTFSNLGQDVVNYAAVNKDAVVVASAGNLAVEEYRYPASFDNVLSVTGVHNNDVFDNGSNPTFTWNDKVDMCAQGFNVFTTATFNGNPVYQATGGTSYAAPQVSGVAALVRSRFPCLSAQEVSELLVDHAVDIESIGTNGSYAGKIGKRVDAAATLGIAVDPCVPIGQTDIGLQQFFLVYPNPATDAVVIRTAVSGNWTAQLTDAKGRVVVVQNFTGRSHDVSGLAAGLYTMTLDNGTQRSSQRLVVVGH